MRTALRTLRALSRPRPIFLDFLRPWTTTPLSMVPRGNRHGSHAVTTDDHSNSDCQSDVTEAPLSSPSFDQTESPCTNSVGLSVGASSPDYQSTDQTDAEKRPDSHPWVRKVKTKAREADEHPTILWKQVLYGKNADREWTFEELTYQSALDRPHKKGRTRLVHQAAHTDDFELWAQILAHRRRIFGIEGTGVVWDQMRKLKVQIPTDGRLGHDFWNSFIDLGLTRRKVLEEIADYMDEKGPESRGLPTLYVRTIQHFALQGNESEVRHWHERLIARHPPAAERFKRMVRTIVYSKGDLGIVRYLYVENQYRNLYAIVIPLLCAQLEFVEALKWHDLLISHHDLPREEKAVAALQSYLERYRPNKAVEFNQSLNDAGVDFRKAQSIAAAPFSREVMNRIHGQTFGIQEKHYNDKIGARWFATRWISLDVAINSVHALGFREIGPLSLQEIALREPTAPQITQRILQLRGLGISLGKSTYSRALEIFARKERHELLKSLLTMDQHPDALEDWKLQESLLGRYASTGDWAQYSRTVAIRLVGSHQSQAEAYNIILRDHVSRMQIDLQSMLGVLEEMQKRALPVKPMSCRYLFRRLLRPRRPGHRPVFLYGEDTKDLEIACSILRQLLKSGSWVPPSIWIEIMKRLGMAGRFRELEALCLTLADWYHPQSTARQKGVFSHCQRSNHLKKFILPTNIKSSHPKHPFAMLFPPALQDAIVAWGFYNHFRFAEQYPTQPTDLKPGSHRCTQGIRLLCRLRHRGVSIYRKSVRGAIINRLLAFYGPGNSNRKRNRSAREKNPFALHELLHEICAACKFGADGKSVDAKSLENRKKPVFYPEEVVGLEKRIYDIGVARMRRVQRKYAAFRSGLSKKLLKKRNFLAGGKQIC